MIRRINTSFSRTPKAILVLISFVMVLVVSVLDYSTGYEMSFAIFYSIPVGFAACFIGRNTGIGLSLVSAVVWQATNKLAGEVLSSPLIYVWNTAVRIVAFSILAILLHELRVALAHEQNLSRTDSLTGIMNRRAFYEVLAKELLRARRYEHPLAIAYIDLDNFKAINDQFGHSTGDSLLRTVADTLERALRDVDTLARLGGDEFAILLPNTDSMGAKKALAKIRGRLQQAMERAGWPVTFSIGAVACPATSTTEDALRKVDEVMYSVKKTGKNAVQVAPYWC